jgi:hypothetical protein
VNQIPGAPNTPAVTTSACPNPTLSSSYHISKGTPAPGTGGGGGTGAQTQSPAAGGAQGTQSPAATASASASYAASASAGSLYSMLPSASYSVYALAASQQIEGAKAPSVLPLLLAAVAVLLLIFGPLFLRIRSRDKIREG